jgi:serine/threonine-protein kinase
LDPDAKPVLPEHIKVPALPQPVLEFSRKADDPEVSARELGRIIEADTGLTVELLRYANSSAMGRRHSASSAQQAISGLGIRRCKMFLLTTAIRNVINSAGSNVIDLPEFWSTNLERGLFARAVAKVLGADEEVAFTGGMLQDCLLPALIDQAADSYQAFFHQSPKHAVELVQFEGESLVWDHAKETGRLAVGWAFPDELVCCVLFHHTGLALLSDDRLRATSVAAVAVSGLLPDQLNQVPQGLEMLHQLDGIVPGFQLMEIAEKVHAEFHDLPSQTCHHVTLFDRCEEECGTICAP